MPASHDERSDEGSAAQIDGVSGSAVCVYCRRRPVDPPWRPFCGERCKVQDLARWIDGDYRVAGEAITPDATAARDSDDE